MDEGGGGGSLKKMTSNILASCFDVRQFYKRNEKEKE